MEPAVTTSSPRSALAEGNINGSDRIVVELLSPPDMPQVIMIRWPQHFTVVAPTHFPYVDIWQAVKPARFGMAGWPEVPRTVEWKHGTATPIRTRRARARARTHEAEGLGALVVQKIFWYRGRGAVLRIAAAGVRFRPPERLVVPPAVSDYEADDERNRGDHNGGDHEKAEQHALICEGHDVLSELGNL